MGRIQFGSQASRLLPGVSEEIRRRDACDPWGSVKRILNRCGSPLLCAALLIGASFYFGPSPAFSQDFEAKFLDGFLRNIENYLNHNGARQALSEINRLREGLEPERLTSRFYFVEAKALLANGYVDQARERIEFLRLLPNWEAQVSEAELLELEMAALKALGRSADALLRLRRELPALDQIDPPYSEEVTRIYLVYADLLFACSKYGDAMDTLFDLVERGSREERERIGTTLLAYAEVVGVNESQVPKLKKAAEGLASPPLHHRFALVAYGAGFPEAATELLDLGVSEACGQMRSVWPAFLKEVEDEAFLELAAEFFFTGIENRPPSVGPSLRAMGAFTYEKLGQSEKALELIEDRLEKDVDLQFFAARVLADKGDIDSASRIYSNLERARPGQFLEPWGTLLAEMGQGEKALAVWSGLPDKLGHTVDSYARWGRLLNMKGYLEEAKIALEEGIRKTAKPIYFAGDLLQVSLALGDVPGALAAYQSLREQSRQNQLLWTPGRLLEQLKQTQQVESFFDSLGEVLAASDTVHAPWRDFGVELHSDLAVHLNHPEELLDWLVNPPPAVAAYWNSSPKKKASHLMNLTMEYSLLGEDEVAVRLADGIGVEDFETRSEVLEAAARSSARIGDTTRAFEYWNRYWASPRTSVNQKLHASMQIARLELDRYRPGKALEWLDKVAALVRVPSVSSEVAFLRGLAFTRLQEKKRAIRYLEQALDDEGINSNDALYWLAEWDLWQRYREDATDKYRALLARDPGQELTNEALWRLRHLSELQDESLPYYSIAAFFETGGRWEEAEENYRKLAAQLGPGDLTDWVYYRIGKMFLSQGKSDEALEQWNLVLDKTENPTLARRIRFEMASLSEDATAEQFEKLVLDSPNTLLGDLAREKMHSIPAPPEPVLEPFDAPVP
jgi:tetratricopeptide (TPR) repeat protein